MEGATGAGEVERRARGDGVRRHLPPEPGSGDADRRVPAEELGGLPVPECLDYRRRRRRPASGHGLDPRRRLEPGMEPTGPIRGFRLRRQGRGAGFDQLPARPARLPGASRAIEGIGRIRQLRLPRSDRGPSVGQPEHRPVWRRPEQRDDLRRVRRRHQCSRLDGKPAGKGPDPPGDRGEPLGHRHGTSARCAAPRAGLPARRTWESPGPRRCWTTARTRPRRRCEPSRPARSSPGPPRAARSAATNPTSLTAPSSCPSRVRTGTRPANRTTCP